MGAISNSEIDFALLDDVLLAPSHRADQIKHILSTRPIKSIGPAIEYALQQPRFSNVLPALDALPETLVTAGLRTAINGGSTAQHLSNTSLTPDPVEFAKLQARNGQTQSAGWVAYLKRLQNAAEQAGFGKTTAAGLVGAAKELIDNVDFHSDAPDSGIVGYAYAGRCFEFVIADAGIGVMASLRKHEEYTQLADHGDALLTALTDGKSRFGSGTNHGWGFRQVFVALADLFGTLRFRSGDHRLEIEGDAPTLPTAKISQTAVYKGFIASIACRPPVSSKNNP